jgi:hypothetical protein
MKNHHNLIFQEELQYIHNMGCLLLIYCGLLMKLSTGPSDASVATFW